MKAAVFYNIGPSENLQYQDLPSPVPGAGEVVVEMRAIGLNFADIYRRRGIYPSAPPRPFVLGMEGAGVVAEIGSEVDNLKVGDRVGFAHVPRANAERVLAPAWKLIPLPDSISFETAASTLLQGLTAQFLSHDSFNIQPGNIVLIHSVSGGVGQLLSQVALKKGAIVFGTVSDKKKIPHLHPSGAIHTIVREKGWQDHLIRMTDGKGFDVVYDAIGSTLETSIALARSHGTVVYFGEAGGPPPLIDPNVLMAHSKRLVGGELWSHIATKEALNERAGILFHALNTGEIKVPRMTTFPLSEIILAHRLLESGTSTGKVLLEPNR